MCVSLGDSGKDEVVVEGVLVEWQHCALFGLILVDVAHSCVFQLVARQYLVLALSHQLAGLVKLGLQHRPLLCRSYAMLFIWVHLEEGRELLVRRQEGIEVATHYNVVLGMALPHPCQGCFQLFDLRLIFDCF